MKKYFLASVVGILISACAFGPMFAAGPRLVTQEDLAVGPKDNTVTEIGHTGHRIPRYYDNNAFTDNLALFGKSITGDNTGRLQDMSIGSASYTDNGYFNDLITKGPYVDVRAGFGGTFDNVADDKAAIQAAVTYGESLNVPWTLYVPHGVNARIKNPVRLTKGNVTVTGGGKIFVDSASFTDNLAVAGYSSNVRAGFIIWDGSATSHYVSPSVPYDPTYDNLMLPNVVVDGVEFYDNFNYGDAYGQFSTALFIGWGTNATIRNNTFKEFKGEVILGILKNSKIINNHFENNSQQAISIFDMNVLTANNTYYKVGCLYEGSLHNSSFVGNVADNVGGGITSGMIIGNSSVRFGVSGKIKGNVITNLNAYQAVTVAQTTANDLYSLEIDGNDIEGIIVGDRDFIYSIDPSADNGALVISNNIIRESSSQSDGYSSAIYILGTLTGTKSSYRIYNNTIILKTAKALTGIRLVSYQKGWVFGNNIVTNAALRVVGLGDYYYLGTNGEYYVNAASATSSFGLQDNLVFGTNYASFNEVRDDVIRVATATDNVANTKGKPTVLMTNSGSINIAELSNVNPGQIVTVKATADNVVLIHGTYLKTTTGSNVTMTANQITQFLVYDVTGNPRHFYVKQLYAPVSL